MKTIILFRHGKSDWDANYNADHERPLARRGIRAAKTMGQWLKQTSQVPDRLVSSSAVRALTTLQLAKEAGGWEGDIHIEQSLYASSVIDYLNVIINTPEDADSVIVTGHEPTCSMTTSKLMGGGLVRFPTATMARIDVDVESWKDVRRQTGQLIWYITPKMLNLPE